jgi:hypothetical protein
MQKKTQYQIIIEVIWLLIIGCACFAILYPIVSKGEYKFTFINVFFIGISILYARFIVLYKDIALLQNKWVRIFIFLINFHFMIWSAIRLQDMIPIWEGQSIFGYMYQLYNEMALVNRNWLLNYVRNEILLFGIATIVMSILLNMRILVSFFRKNSIRRNAMMNDLG